MKEAGFLDTWLFYFCCVATATTRTTPKGTVASQISCKHSCCDFFCLDVGLRLHVGIRT